MRFTSLIFLIRINSISLCCALICRYQLIVFKLKLKWTWFRIMTPWITTWCKVRWDRETTIQLLRIKLMKTKNSWHILCCAFRRTFNSIFMRKTLEDTRLAKNKSKSWGKSSQTKFQVIWTSRRTHLTFLYVKLLCAMENLKIHSKTAVLCSESEKDTCIDHNNYSQF